jgi:hypothetical protein
MLSGKTPEEVNKVIPYVNGCLIEDTTAAKALNIEFHGKTKTPPVGFGWCIAETNHYENKGVPQHFFVYDADTKKRVDPLDLNPVPEENSYHIVSYRLFKPLINEEKTMVKEFVEAIEVLCEKKYGDNLNEDEQKGAAKRLNALHDYIKSIEAAIVDYTENPKEKIVEKIVEVPVEVVVEKVVEKFVDRLVYPVEMTPIDHFRVGMRKFLGIN